MEQEERHHEKHKFHYFVDGIKYETEESHVTGVMIKIKLPESNRGYALYLEGNKHHPDTLINDDTSISLEGEPKHFYTVPPASFGNS